MSNPPPTQPFASLALSQEQFAALLSRDRRSDTRHPALLKNPRDPELIYQFINEVELFAPLHHVGEGEVVEYALKSFGADLLRWYAERMSTIASWIDLKTQLVQCFVPPRFEDNMAEKLYSLQQTSTVEAYTSEFRRIKGYLTHESATDRQVKNWYVKGLSPALFPYLIEDVYNPQVSFDSLAYKAQIRADLTGPVPVVGFYPRYDVPGHIPPAPAPSTTAVDPDAMDIDALAVRRKKLSPQERAHLMATGGCFACRRPGHHASQCAWSSKGRSAGNRMSPVNTSPKN
ncbi:uncharacterized protein SPAPADRAFT_142720 [Spathaspora passalidarum NRRL Y-27907]|uniref:CCHC-type domain-containing protein n=1 Tax=Spathaspora passalidarum (strain NRRL Y-27907 / 11-Y1) TaxID=619300 RepID=G3AS64_SPAPN|nr:uncharacterized protein SPAPADRAFT_142720 [Spathaspora passalidarum NRRL Y-27907]EGW31023.1 hypothetical protein SPAPADRAFT_142720 [Spathaspora passalidarum NRRL Y-27907]